MESDVLIKLDATYEHGLDRHTEHTQTLSIPWCVFHTGRTHQANWITDAQNDLTRTTPFSALVTRLSSVMANLLSISLVPIWGFETEFCYVAKAGFDAILLPSFFLS